MHKLPKKPAGTSSAEGQAVNTNTTNNSRERTRSHNNNNSNNNTRGRSTNRSNTNDNNNNRNISNISRGNNNNNTRRNSNRSRGKANNNSNNNDNSNRGKNKGKRGGQRNDESEEEEESSTYLIDEQSEQYSDHSDTEENRAIHSLPGDFFDCDEHAQRYIWHGPAPVCSSRTAYQSSPFKLDHSFAGWQRVDEHFDMPWPPPLRIRCKSFNHSRMTEAFKVVELDINRWENILTDLWEPAVFNDEYILLLSWVITRLQYLRALYPVMDANKYDFNMSLYYDRAVLIMNTKGPDCTAVVDFISRKKEDAQEDSSVYFDKWFKNNTHFGKWYKDQSTSTQKSANKHNIESPQDTPAHKKAKTNTASTVVPPPSILKPAQEAPTTPTAKQASAAVNPSSPNPLASGFAATPSSKPRPGRKRFANLPTSPNLLQANATSRTIASNPQSQSTVTSRTTETPPAPSLMSFTPLSTTTAITTPTRGGDALLPTPAISTVSAVPTARLPLAPHVARHQSTAAPPPPPPPPSPSPSPSPSPPLQATLEPILQHATPLTPTTAHSIPPPKLTHQLPPKPQTTAFPATPTTRPTPAQSTPSKTAPQPTLTSSWNIPAPAQPATNQPTKTPSISPKTAHQLQQSAPQPTRTSPRNKTPQTTPAQPTAAHPATHLDAERARLEQELEEYITQAPKESAAPTPPVIQSTRKVKRGHAQYHSPVIFASPKQQPSLRNNKIDTLPVSPVPEKTRSTKAPLQTQPQQHPPPVEQGLQPLNKEVAEKKVDASTNAALTVHNWMVDTPMDLELDNVIHHEQQQQPTKPSGEMLSAIKKNTTEKIVCTIVTKDDNPLQDPQDTSMVALQPDAVVALGPQLHYHHPQLQQPKEPKPVATTTMATAEVNIPSLLQDFKSWIEAETRKHQDQSALLQSLFAKNTLLESKLEAHTTRWDDEVKKQEAYRSISTMTHSCEFDLASLKERTLAQDLKISQLEAHLESRIRYSLEKDLAVVRNELQEERVDNLTKDLKLKRAEAMEVMAKARAEMRDARQMVSEAREERANAMERAARAEADNQMLLRVINELQGTGWRVSGQAQAQGLQGQDAGIHHTGLLSSSVHPRSPIDHPHYPLTTTAAGSSTFMRFGTAMRQTYSSSSTESLASAEAAGEEGAARTAVTDPSIHRMDVISVKLENDYIARLHAVIPNPDLDPDMTEDDEGRTDTDHDATDEE